MSNQTVGDSLGIQEDEIEEQMSGDKRTGLVYASLINKIMRNTDVYNHIDFSFNLPGSFLFHPPL